MSYVKPRPSAAIVLAYLGGGYAIGAALPWLKDVGSARWGRSGIAVAFVINVAMPLWIILASAVYPRLGVALAGTLAAVFGFLTGVGYPFRTPTVHWLRELISDLGPILSVATIGYFVLAVATVLIIRRVRQVGVAPHPFACRSCDYLLVGITSDRCPECGAEIPGNQRGCQSR